MDAIHLLSETIRDRAGVDGDGVQLVGAALGGSTPPLRITGLRTETEKSVQKGFSNIFIGLYQAIRNPRSHNQYNDRKEDADAILVFLDYLITIVSDAKSPYNQNDFRQRVLDPLFPMDREYARLLIEEVPLGKRLELAVGILQNRDEQSSKSVRLFFDCCFASLDTDDHQTLLRFFVEDLRAAKTDHEIQRILKIFPPRLWGAMPSICRRKVEHRLILSANSGFVHYRREKVTDGELGLHLTDLYKDMECRAEMIDCFKAILESENRLRIAYLCKYFSRILVELDPELTIFETQAILKELESGSAHVFHAFQWLLSEAPTSNWCRALENQLNNFEYLEDNTPF